MVLESRFPRFIYVKKKMISIRNRVNAIDVFCLTFSGVVLFFFAAIFSETSKTYTLSLCVICVWLTVFGYIRFAQKTGTMINPFGLFWLSVCVFSLGQAYVFLFDRNPSGIFSFTVYSPALVNKYLNYALLSFIFLLAAGFRIMRRKSNSNEMFFEKTGLSDVDRIVFLLFWIISIPFYFSNVIKSISATALGGYEAIYSIKTSGIMSMWFIPSSFALIIAYKGSWVKYFFLAALLVPFIGYLFVGTRTVPLAIAISVICLWNFNVKRFSRKVVVLTFAVGVLGLIVISLIRELRGVTAKSLDDYLNILLTINPFELILDAIAEMGGSMQIWLRLQHIVPQQVPYMLGFSYLASILSCIPSFLIGGFSFAKYANLSVWITEIERESYGLGFLMLGETYCNFGWFGIPFMFILAKFIFKMLSGQMIRKEQFIRYSGFISSASLFFFATLARDSLYLCIRQILYCLIVPIFVSQVVEQFILKMKKSACPHVRQGF